MGPFAAQLLLESVLVPFAVAGLIVAGCTRLFKKRALAPALAVIVAVGVTYGLAFGWLLGPTVDARAKIMLTGVIAVFLGLIVDGRHRWPMPVLLIGAIGIPLWIGLPALLQGRPQSALLILPITIAIAAGRPNLGGMSASRTSSALIALSLALGLAIIAAHARTLSFAQISLALASALAATLMVGRQPLGLPATLAAAGMLLALTSALLLYSQASVTAVIILATVIGADPLTRLWSSDKLAEPHPFRLLPFCALSVLAAAIIARIDAGPISIY